MRDPQNDPGYDVSDEELERMEQARREMYAAQGLQEAFHVLGLPACLRQLAELADPRPAVFDGETF